MMLRAPYTARRRVTCVVYAWAPWKLRQGVDSKFTPEHLGFDSDAEPGDMKKW
jgi:hypothetical protein